MAEEIKLNHDQKNALWRLYGIDRWDQANDAQLASVGYDRNVELKASKLQELINKGEKLETDAQRRNRAFDEGALKGRELIGNLGRVDEKLGRVDEGVFNENQSADTQDILARRRAALSGVDSQAALADRERATQEFQRVEEGGRRRLAGVQAQLGVRGDTAATQQAGVLFQGMQNRANYERDLIIANTQLRAQALNEYESSVKGAEAAQQVAKASNIQLKQYNYGQQLKERELQQFNSQQTARERFGAISTGFGFQSLESAAQSAEKQVAASNAAAATRSSGGK